MRVVLTNLQAASLAGTRTALALPQAVSSASAATTALPSRHPAMPGLHAAPARPVATMLQSCLASPLLARAAKTKDSCGKLTVALGGWRDNSKASHLGLQVYNDCNMIKDVHVVK